MKVIFLDIDGVLNCEVTMAKLKNNRTGIDAKLVSRFNRILRSTDAKVVLSSTWRLWPYWRQAMKDAGLIVGRFIDITPYNKGLTSRGTEVKQWLDLHPEVTKFCCIDDGEDFLEGQTLFKCSPLTGLTDEIANRVIQYLYES